MTLPPNRASVTPPSSVGFGIIGTGMIAEFHARAIAEAHGGQLIAVASRNLHAAEVFATKHGVPVATATIQELLAAPGLDVVCITTPSGAHREPALAAIQAGKHVVIEKPLEVTTARADEILAAADQHDVRVAAIFQARFGDAARRVKAAIDAGRFGRMVLASAYVKWHRAPSYYHGWKGTLRLDGGGVLINQAIHAVDLLQWCAGMPEEVFAWQTRRVHTAIEAEDTVVAALRFSNGSLGTIEATTGAWPGWRRRLELTGEHGSVVLEDDAITRWDFRDARPDDAPLVTDRTSGLPGSGAGAPNSISAEGHRRQIQDMIDALQSGRPLAVDGKEARKALMVVRAIYESTAANTAVHLTKS